MRSYWRIPALVLSCLLFLGAAAAQVSTATFYGIVTDSSRALVPSAAVTMTNAQTGVAYRKVSDSTGEFAFDFLPTGAYDLRIESRGFKTSETKGITLTAGQQARQTYVLDVGSISETVSVAGTAPLLNAVFLRQHASLAKAQSLRLSY